MVSSYFFYNFFGLNSFNKMSYQQQLDFILSNPIIFKYSLYLSYIQHIGEYDLSEILFKP